MGRGRGLEWGGGRGLDLGGGVGGWWETWGRGRDRGRGAGRRESLGFGVGEKGHGEIKSSLCFGIKKKGKMNNPAKNAHGTLLKQQNGIHFKQ